MMTLRPYQVRAIQALRQRVVTGVRRLLLIAPTGSGKTVMAAAMIQSAVAKQKRILFLAHRKELIDQTFDKLFRFGVNAGVIMGSDGRRDDFLATQIASVQTLARRLDQLPPADIVVIDEAHHAIANSYRAIVERYPSASVIGLTATPWRAGKLTLAEMFDEAVVAATPAQLFEIQALVPYEAFAYDAPELSDVRSVGGDYNQKQLAVATNTSVLVGSVVREYLEHARGRRAILFPVDVQHSEHLVGEFRANGVNAAHLDCHTPKLERERILSGLASGDVAVVSSVGVLTEGFDCPAAEVCILARPTQSLSLHLQMIGRVLRLSPETGKVRALIHDHAGNLLRHGFVEDDRDYSLTATPQRDRDMHTCPFCKFLFDTPKPDGTCPKCGELIAMAIEKQREERGSRTEKTVVDGKRLTAAQIREMRIMREKRRLRNDLTDEQLVLAAHATPEEKAAEYKRLLAVAERKGFDEGWAAHRYRDSFGVWPRGLAELLEHVEPARAPFFPLPPRREEQAA